MNKGDALNRKTIILKLYDMTRPFSSHSLSRLSEYFMSGDKFGNSSENFPHIND